MKIEMDQSSDSSDELEALAVELARAVRSYWALSADVRPQNWSERLGVRLDVADYAADGRYVRFPRPTIRLRRDRAVARARFTFAHEVGHHIAEEVRRNARFRERLSPELLWRMAGIPPSSSDEEAFCDRFAAELMLSRSDALTWLERDATKADDFLRLSKSHGMSLSATLRRVRDLGFSGSLVVLRQQDRQMTAIRSLSCPLPEGSHLDGELGPDSFNSEHAWMLWSAPNGERFRTRGDATEFGSDSYLMLVRLVARDSTDDLTPDCGRQIP